MKITTNTIGNYAPHIVRNNVRQTEPNETANQAETKKAAQKQTDNLSADEKNLFMNLYPQSKPEIVDYHFYQRSGKMSGVKIGFMLDRRG